MDHVLSHGEVMAKYPSGTWQHAAALDAIDHLTAGEGQPFPCVFAIRAAVQGGLRYCFAEVEQPRPMADGLREFLRGAREIGPYASLSYVYAPEETQTIESYHDRFWNALRGLHAADERPWPSNIPSSLLDPDWTFCFDDEAIFPLCLTPAHTKKRTRYAQNFTISFQPRWTFKHHLPDKGSMERYSRLIQDRITRFDASPISPFLGLYGQGFLDAQKYFFDDDNRPMGFPEAL